MHKRYWSWLLIGLLALDLGLTFWQNYQLPLDGDLVPIVSPAPWYGQVLKDPFGWAVLSRNEVYAAPNRFFAHAGMSLYWKQMPRLLQHFSSPISSLYLASAFFNTAMQAALILLLAAYARLAAGSAFGESRSWHFWLAAALVAPLFQMNGFYEQLGITNQAVTYTFFYAFPAALLLLLLWPFFRAACLGQPLQLPWWRAVLLFLLMVVVAFNGPVAAAAVAVLLLAIGGYWLGQRRRAAVRWPAPGGRLAQGWLSGQALLLLLLLAALSGYSLFIGRNNAENSHSHSLAQLYQLLPIGIVRELGVKPALPLLLLLLILNGQLIRRYVPAESVGRRRVLTSMRWTTIFAVVFLLLLPFGGYRSYRPYLIRGDSILPILIGVFYLYTASSLLLLRELRGRWRPAYVGLVVAVAAFFTWADRTTQMPRTNDCERWALDQMARSPEAVVKLAPFCNVLTWESIPDSNYTLLHAGMLHYWGITDRPKPYYQPPQ